MVVLEGNAFVIQEGKQIVLVPAQPFD